MKVKSISKLIGGSESMVVEWKQSLSEINEIIETITAFANTEGGQIFIGISPEGKIIGISIGKGTIEKMVNQISQSTDPKIHPKVTIKKIGGKDIVLIEVKESHDHLVLAFGRPYQRVGRSTVRMSKDEYERLIYEKHKEKLHFDTLVCRGATLRDIDSVKVRWFFDKAKEERRLTIPVKVSTKEGARIFESLSKWEVEQYGYFAFW